MVLVDVGVRVGVAVGQTGTPAINVAQSARNKSSVRSIEWKTVPSIDIVIAPILEKFAPPFGPAVIELKGKA